MSRDEKTYITTIVRPSMEARPNELADNVYVTESDLESSVNPVWDLAGFPHLYRVVAKFTDGALQEVSPECPHLAGIIRDMPSGSYIRADVPLVVLDQIMELVVNHLSATAAPPWGQKLVTSEGAYQIKTNPKSQGSDAHDVEVVEIGGGRVFKRKMTQDQACFTLLSVAEPRTPTTRQRP